MKRLDRYGLIVVLSFLLSMCASPAGKKWNELASQYRTTLDQSKNDYAKSNELTDIAKQALQWAEQNFKPKDPRRAQSLLFLAEAHSYNWDYAQAETLYKQALALYEQIHKQQTIDYARGLKGLGLLYGLQGNSDPMFTYLQQAQGILEKLPNPNVKELADVLYFLAMACDFQKKDFSVSESYYKRSLEIKKKVLGEIHPDVAEDLAGLASQYRIHRRFQESESLYQQALAILEKLYGPDDPKVAGQLERIGTYYYEQKEYSYAESYLKRALPLWEKIHGPESVKLAPFFVRRGNYYNEWGQPEQAELFYQKELAVKEKAFGMDSSELDWPLERLYKFFDTRKNFDRAEQYFDRWLPIREKTLEPNTAFYYEELRDYAEFYVKWGRWSKAEELYRRLLSSFVNFPDKNWEFEAWVAERLADLCVIQYKYDEAEVFGKQALAAWEKVESRDKIEFVEFLESMAIYYRGNNKIKEAEELEKRAKEIRAKLPKAETPPSN
jgi:tetratricopeptide (TPR) repeat protein